MSSSALLMLSSKSFIVSGLIFRSLICFEFIFFVWCQEVFEFHFFLFVALQFSQHQPLIEEVVFALLYILASFVKNKIPIVSWVYFWTILFHWFIFLFLCQYHTVLMFVVLQCNLTSGSLILPAPFFFFKAALAIRGLLCFHMSCEKFLLQFCEKCH